MESTAKESMSAATEVPVLIVGGGACGLALSCFLSNYGVKHFLLERRLETSKLPKAHYLNQRTMETFRQHAMVDEILQKACPPKYMSRVAWMTSLGGSEPMDRQVIHTLPCHGGEAKSAEAEAYRRDAPLRSVNLPQMRLEPILRQLAENRNPGCILYNTEVTQVHEEEISVVVVGTDATNSQLLYRCQYLIAADGGRTIGPRVGINMLGPTGLADMVSVHFSADLSAFWDDRNILCYLLNECPGSGPEKGVIVPTGPTWGRHSEEWVFQVGFDHNDPQRFQEDVLIAKVRNLLKTPDVDIKVHKISHYAIERVLADAYQKGNIFVVGDAAHRQPPTTGLGLNTGLEDCLNLAWKLALVLRYGVSPSVLNTYESERRAVGEKNCDWGLFTFNNSVLIDAAMGLITPLMKANQDRLRFLFTKSAQAQSLRAQLARIVSSQDVELSTHGIELGFQYDHGFFIAECGPSPLSDPLGIQYFPTTKPGNRLPHAWIQSKDGIKSTHDLVGAHGAFGLIIDKDGAPWASAARSASIIHGVNISIAEIDGGCQYQDYDGQWDQVKEIGTGGALLVRPDNIVAWRSIHRSQTTGQELVRALEHLFACNFEPFGGRRSTKL